MASIVPTLWMCSVVLFMLNVGGDDLLRLAALLCFTQAAAENP